MKQLTCEMCGSTDFIKQDGVFVCQSCGIKYSVEEAKKIMIEGAVEITGTVHVDDTNKVDTLLKRVFAFLEDEDWGEADNYCEKVLDIDPENMQAYLGKLMAEYRIENQEKLEKRIDYYAVRVGRSNNYKRLLRFGSSNLISLLKNAVEQHEKKVQQEEEIKQKEQEKEQAILKAKLAEKIPVLQEKRNYLAKASGLISAGEFTYIAALKSDGTILIKEKYEPIERLLGNDVVSISASKSHVVALNSDGTVSVAAPLYGQIAYGAGLVYDWENIVAISTADVRTIGLKSDGTVVVAGANNEGADDVSDWRNIMAISAIDNCTFGLKSDGTVVDTQEYFLGTDFDSENRIVAISAASSYALALKANGTVELLTAFGYYPDEGTDINVSDWEDIVAISANFSHAVGLKADGTVVATGANNDRECNVTSWKNIVAISTGYQFTIGLQADGTVLTTRWEDRDILSKWKLFNDYSTLEEEKQREKFKRQFCCQYCGGEFKGFFKKSCTNCGKKKDY